MRRIYILLCLALLAGCASKESKIPGTWTFGNTPVELTKDHKFTMSMQTPMGAQKMEGTWELKGDVVRVTPTTFAGKPVAELEAEAKKMSGQIPNSEKVLAAIHDMVKPDDFTLSDDGKTLTMKNPKQGQPSTLTKKE
jgi:hypothetical protein